MNAFDSWTKLVFTFKHILIKRSLVPSLVVIAEFYSDVKNIKVAFCVVMSVLIVVSVCVCVSGSPEEESDWLL